MSLRLSDIERAREGLARWLRPSPLVRSRWLSEWSGTDVWLKLESLQPTHSFKIRGALHAVSQILARGDSRPPRLVTASTGNHGLGLATAARWLGAHVTVFAPRTAPRAKVDAIRHAGATLRAESADVDDAERDAIAWAEENGAAFVSAYNHPDIIAGAGTVGLEILEFLPQVRTIVVPVGGGGLISGIATAIRARQPDVHLVGVEAAGNPAFRVSMANGRITPIEPRPTLADGLSGNLEPGSLTFEIVQRLVPDMLAVEEDEIREALAGLLVEERIVAEGAGIVPVAALLGERVRPLDGPIVLIISGANIDLTRLIDIAQSAPPIRSPR